MVLGVFLYCPRTRWALITTAILLGMVGSLVVTPAGFLDYIIRTLPAQASETSWPFQYSLTYALHFFGIPADIAQVLGSLSYIAMLLLSLWLAPRLVARLQRREMFAFVPAMCAVIGGPYVHNVEIPAAVPAVLVLATTCRGTIRNVASIALCVLILPWMQLWGTKKLFAAGILLSALILLRLRLRLRLIIPTLVSLATMIFAFERTPPPGAPPSARMLFSPNALASVAWEKIIPTFEYHGFEWFAIKLPTWAALVAALVLVVYIAVDVKHSANINALSESRC